MTSRLEGEQIPPGTAAEVEDPVWPAVAEVAKQGIEVLAHVMVPCALPESSRAVVVVADGERAGLSEFFGGELGERQGWVRHVCLE